MPAKKETSMPFLKHLEELRGCLLRCIIAVVVGFVIAYAFSETIYNLLLIPFNEAYRAVLEKEPNLIFTNILEPFLAYLKISLVAGIFISSPYIFFEVWKFIAPGLYKNEKKLIIPFVSLAVIFFTGGALFAYFLVFPVGFEFFMGYSTEFIQPAIKVSDYLKISLSLLLVFGLVFELPLIILFLVHLNILSTKTLISKWQYIIISIAFASALLTPADPFSMILMMVSLLFLYGITIGGAYLISLIKK